MKNTFGNRLRMFREQAGLTQTDLAKRLNVHPQRVNNIEQGRCKNPSLQTMSAIAKALGITVIALLGEKKLSLQA